MYDPVSNARCWLIQYVTPQGDWHVVKLATAIKTRQSHTRHNDACVQVRSKWMALRTKSRQEKAVAKCITAMQGECYLPLLNKARVHRGQAYRSMMPAFPGYVFYVGQRDDLYVPALSRRVCQILDIPDQAGFLQELDYVRRVLESASPVKLHPFAINGRRCRIYRGPLTGVEGVVIGRKDDVRLVLQVDIVGQGVSVEIDVDLLEAAD